MCVRARAYNPEREREERARAIEREKEREKERERERVCAHAGVQVLRTVVCCRQITYL